MTTKKHRFDTSAETFYLETLICGFVVQKDKLMQNNAPVHTPKNCKNCRQNKYPVMQYAYTGFCNREKCAFETDPNTFDVVTELMKEHVEESHKPKKGRPVKNKEAQ